MEHIKRNSIFKNIVHLFMSTVLSRGLNTITLLIMAGYLSSSYYGMFSVALAFSMVAGYFTDAGLSNTVLREGSKKNAQIASILSSYVRIRMVLLSLTLAVSFLIIQIFYDSYSLILTMYYLMIPMITGLAFQSIGITYFQLTEQMNRLGTIRILSSIFLIVLIGFGMFAAVSPFVLSSLFGISYLLAGLYGMHMVRKELRWSMKEKFEKRLLGGIGAFLVGGLIMMLLPQLGPLILEKTLPLELVGLFAIAYRIPSALYQVPGIIGGAFYPVLFQTHNLKEYDKHTNLNILQVKLMALIGLALTIPIYHLSQSIIMFLFGADWLSAAPLLRILALLLVLQGASIALADGLTTKGMQGHRTLIQLITVVIGCICYYASSRTYGVSGAAYTALCLEAIALIGFWICNPERWKIAKKVLLPYTLLSVIVLKGTNFLLSNHSIWSLLLSILFLAAGIGLDRELCTLAINYINKRYPARKKAAEM